MTEAHNTALIGVRTARTTAATDYIWPIDEGVYDINSKKERDICVGQVVKVHSVSTHGARDRLPIVIQIRLHLLPRLELQIGLLPLFRVQHDLSAGCMERHQPDGGGMMKVSEGR